jgi:N-acetylmuramic acid 6-phosphate (MurNAc-6-P) etherase
VKEAVLALLTDCSPDEARARLALSSGDLRAALGEAAQA